MASPRPEDIRPGAIPRDPDCHKCPHRWHLLPCGCGCTDHSTPGIDT